MSQENKKPGIPKADFVPHLSGKAKVSSKGGIVIPKDIRDALDIEPGDELSIMLIPPSYSMKQDKRLSSIHIIKVPKTREELLELTTGMFPQRPGQPSWTENLLQARREEVEREERELRGTRARRHKTA